MRCKNLKIKAIYICQYRAFNAFCVPDGVFLCARAEISLDLSLVHAIEGQHEEDPADPQSPEGVSLCRVRVQAEPKRENTDDTSNTFRTNLHDRRFIITVI